MPDRHAGVIAWIREPATAALLTTLYLSLVYLLNFGVSPIAAGFIHPIAQDAWLIRYAVAVSVLELVAAVLASVWVALAAHNLAGSPTRTLWICGGSATICILLWPNTLTIAGSPLTVVWTALIHGVAPAVAGAMLGGFPVGPRPEVRSGEGSS